MEKKNTKTRGLVLGKFAPLHKGHQYLIETALQEMDEVIVMIYNCPETIDVPLNVRANWIRNLYPKAKVFEAWDGPTETGHSERIKKLNEDYVLEKIKVPITHFYSSEWYGEHMSQALGSVNRVVDMDRKKIPISGTLIRNNPLIYKKYMDPIVFNDVARKIVFLGAESTGKSTISQKLAEIYETEWMPEYGREYWEKNNIDGKLTPEQLVELAKTHIEQEQDLFRKAKNYLFVDTNAITTEMFSRFYHGFAHPELKKLAQAAERNYDLCFVCDVDIPYEDDGQRSGEEHRIKFQKQILDDLEVRKVKFFMLQGSLGERINKVKSILKMLNVAEAKYAGKMA
jgi:HTH-type transcriptional regulator, transcriptional repressor of NAD biosynthesis genes